DDPDRDDVQGPQGGAIRRRLPDGPRPEGTRRARLYRRHEGRELPAPDDHAQGGRQLARLGHVLHEARPARRAGLCRIDWHIGPTATEPLSKRFEAIPLSLSTDRNIDVIDFRRHWGPPDPDSS